MPKSSPGRYRFPRGWWSEIPKGFSVKRLLSRGEQLVRQASCWHEQHYGYQVVDVTEGDISLLVGVCRQVLKRAKPDAVYGSLVHLVGNPLGQNRLVAEMTRLAGVEHLLREGVAVPPWRQQIYPEWVCCVLGEPEQTQDTSLLPLNVIAGTPCGKVGHIPLTSGLLHFLTKRLGFRPKSPEMRFYHRSHLAGLYCWARAESSEWSLRLRDITVTQTLVRQNRKLIREVVGKYLAERKKADVGSPDSTYWWG